MSWGADVKVCESATVGEPGRRAPTSGRVLLCLLVLTGVCLTCCSEPERQELVSANVHALAAFDPDFTDGAEPVPGRILWIATRAGTGRFLSGGVELTEVPRVAVDGGELAVTDFVPEVLEPGDNYIEIRFALERHGGTELTAGESLFVSADCTTHDHCPSGACVDYSCQE